MEVKQQLMASKIGIDGGGLLPLLAVSSSARSNPTLPRRQFSFSLKHKETRKFKSVFSPVRSQASNVGVGSSEFDGREEFNSQNISSNGLSTESSSQIDKRPSRIPYPLSIAMVLGVCALAFSLVMFVKGGPSSILAAIAKTGFTAAFTLIFVSEIGDKVLLGSMGALGLMTILSVIIGRVFQSVPAQFQTTLPIGEYAAVTLLLFFGLKSIKDAWDLPADDSKDENKDGSELGEYTEAEELVKASKRLTNPFEILWKSFCLVFFAEWGDRSMLATIALGAAQSPWGVASGAIVGHLVATSVAVLGGAFLAKYISEKLVGYLGGVLFLLFAVATFFGFF
uniref:GDT1 family protein n=1 Tax=Chenopodium quinoa TaxID=63459 RepID=A0A803LVY4_CHEQI